MGVQAREKTLYEMIEALPEGYTGEILSGTLHVNPRPAGPHIRTGSNLGADIAYPFDRARGGPGGWWILDEPEVHFVLDIEVSVPDIAGWRRERMPEIPHDHRFTVVPDWVCEIVSPSSVRTDRTVKMPIYAQFGVSYMWLVDPAQRLIEAFKNVDAEWVDVGQASEASAIRLPPFDAVEITPPWDW